MYLLNKFLYFLNSLNKTQKNTGNVNKILEKSRKFISPKMWEPWKSTFQCEGVGCDHRLTGWANQTFIVALNTFMLSVHHYGSTQY